MKERRSFPRTLPVLTNQLFIVQNNLFHQVIKIPLTTILLSILCILLKFHSNPKFSFIADTVLYSSQKTIQFHTSQHNKVIGFAFQWLWIVPVIRIWTKLLEWNLNEIHTRQLILNGKLQTSIRYTLYEVHLVLAFLKTLSFYWFCLLSKKSYLCWSGFVDFLELWQKHFQESLSVLMLCTPVCIFTSGSSALLGHPHCGLSIWLSLLAIFSTLFRVYTHLFARDNRQNTKILQVHQWLLDAQSINTERPLSYQTFHLGPSSNYQ